MHFALVYPSLPPKMDGIGDFTSRLSQVLAQKYQVTVLAGEGDFDDMPPVAIESLYSTHNIATFDRLFDWAKEHKPDVLLIQYNPFSYARRGFNPRFPRVVRQIRRELPNVRIVMMAHEAYITTENLRTALMATYQRRQFRSLVGSAHVVLSSSETWAQQISTQYKHPSVGVFFVGSNIPDAAIPRDIARRDLNLKPNQVVLGFFGTAHPSRPIRWLARAVDEVCKSGTDAVLLYAGPHGDALRQGFKDEDISTDLLIDLGRQSIEGVSRSFSAMDVYLCPFTDGASTRRTTLMTGLQHGIATLTTLGHNTDKFLQSCQNQSLIMSSADDKQGFIDGAVRLCADPGERARIGVNAQELYSRHFDWPVISGHLVDAILTGNTAHLQSTP